MTEYQQPALSWRGEVPVAEAFQDPYYSLEDGLSESRHVFLEGNGLPERFAPGFHIAELGFGTGLNAFAALQAWLQSEQEGPLQFTSFEKHPMTGDDMARALSPWPEIAELAKPVVAALAAGEREFASDSLNLSVVVGDARETLPAWDGAVNAWFLDGFSPARNPELWEPELLFQVAEHTVTGGTAATYSAAGAVRRSLEDAGFDVSRVTGYARKRHMTVARKP